MLVNKMPPKPCLGLLFYLTMCLCHACGNGHVSYRSREIYGVVSEEETLPYRRCHQDTDCVYMANGCCRCGIGMKELSVNRTLLSAFQEQVRLKCYRGATCPDAGWVPDCGNGGNICKDNVCTYIEAKMDGSRIFWEYPKGLRHYRDEAINFDQENSPAISETRAPPTK